MGDLPYYWAGFQSIVPREGAADSKCSTKTRRKPHGLSWPGVTAAMSIIWSSYQFQRICEVGEIVVDIFGKILPHLSYSETFAIRKKARGTTSFLKFKNEYIRMSLEVPWLRLCRSPGAIPGQGPRSHMPQLRVSMPQWRLEFPQLGTAK